MPVSRSLICYKHGEVSGLFRRQNLSGYRCFLHVLMVHGQSWQSSGVCGGSANPAVTEQCGYGWVPPPASHSCLCCPFSVAPLKGMPRCCCTLNLAEAAPWEAVFFGHSLKAAGRLLWVTCWVNKFLPSWAALSAWGGYKSTFAPPVTPKYSSGMVQCKQLSPHMEADTLKVTL